jgi:hypothetical protein
VFTDEATVTAAFEGAGMEGECWRCARIRVYDSGLAV